MPKTSLSRMGVLVVLLVITCFSCSNDSDDIDAQPAMELPAERAFTTGLPVVLIDTPDSQAIQSKTEWIANARLRIVAADGEEACLTITSIRGRGNVTWSRYPKKPYSLKLDHEAGLLGMKPAKRWVLLANWADRTLLRNDVAFEIARQTSLEWTPQGTPVELILNGSYRGSYYLCEKIQIHENRLNITEMDENDEDDVSITGGYLMEIDQYFDEPDKFRSAIWQLPYQFRSPKKEALTKRKFAYMEQYVNRLEETLADNEAVARGDYRQWIDPLSFVDWWIVNELCYNKEVGRPKSVYVYKPRAGQLKAGPVWDFDFATFTPRENIYVANRFPYLRSLFQSPDFQVLAKRRWAELRPKMERIPDYIEQRAGRIRSSAEQNIRLWPITQKLNGDEQMTFDEAIARMKLSYALRMTVIDEFLSTFTER